MPDHTTPKILLSTESLADLDTGCGEWEFYVESSWDKPTPGVSKSGFAIVRAWGGPKGGPYTLVNCRMDCSTTAGGAFSTSRTPMGAAGPTNAFSSTLYDSTTPGTGTNRKVTLRLLFDSDVRTATTREIGGYAELFYVFSPAPSPVVVARTVTSSAITFKVKLTQVP